MNENEDFANVFLLRMQTKRSLQRNVHAQNVSSRSIIISQLTSNKQMTSIFEIFVELVKRQTVFTLLVGCHRSRAYAAKHHLNASTIITDRSPFPPLLLPSPSQFCSFHECDATWSEPFLVLSPSSR